MTENEKKKTSEISLPSFKVDIRLTFGNEETENERIDGIIFLESSNKLVALHKNLKVNPGQSIRIWDFEQESTIDPIYSYTEFNNDQIVHIGHWNSEFCLALFSHQVMKFGIIPDEKTNKYEFSKVTDTSNITEIFKIDDDRFVGIDDDKKDIVIFSVSKCRVINVITELGEIDSDVSTIIPSERHENSFFVNTFDKENKKSIVKLINYVTNEISEEFCIGEFETSMIDILLTKTGEQIGIIGFGEENRNSMSVYKINFSTLQKTKPVEVMSLVPTFHKEKNEQESPQQVFHSDVPEVVLLGSKDLFAMLVSSFHFKKYDENNELFIGLHNLYLQIVDKNSFKVVSRNTRSQPRKKHKQYEISKISGVDLSPICEFLRDEDEMERFQFLFDQLSENVIFLEEEQKKKFLIEVKKKDSIITFPKSFLRM